MELPVVSLRVKDWVNCLYVQFVDGHRLCLRWQLACGGWSIAVEQRDVQNAVLLDSIRKVSFDSILIDDLTYRVRTCMFIIQQLWRSYRPEVPSWDPDVVSNVENTLYDTGLFTLISLSLLQVLAESLVSLLHASCETVFLYFRNQARWLHHGLTLRHQMVMGIRPDRSHQCSCVYGVNVSEFC